MPDRIKTVINVKGGPINDCFLYNHVSAACDKLFGRVVHNTLIWGGTNSSHLQLLIVQQKKIVRIFSDSSYFSQTNPIFYKLNRLKLLDLHKFYATVYIC